MFINIHSHSPGKANEWVIQNLYKNLGLPVKEGIYSAGLHPWYIKELTWQNEMEELKKLTSQPNVLAIGECGLDRVTSTSFDFQQKVFIAQLLWANEINKPLIIHCVRAHEELLILLKKHQNKVPVIFHGYNKNAELAKKILDAGCWISFGEAIMKPAIAAVFHSMPFEKIFLETDDSTTEIQSIYNSAAAIKNISLEALSLQIHKNLQTVFKIII